MSQYAVPVVWSPETRRHDPRHEVWVGVPTEGTERADRVDAILEALRADGHELVEAAAQPDDALLAVHDAELVEFLSTAAERWDAGPYDELVGQERVVPYLFPTPAMTAGLPARPAVAIHADAGRFVYDTMTLVGPGTWEAARAAVDCAVQAAGLVSDGARLAYALCRPPGHHATPAGFGGSCYLNNAAVAAAELRSRGAARVGIVDIDAHQGNGTAAIFYDRADVRYGSVHVDPGAGWFPHVVGYADETGSGAGEGATRNLPLPEGTGDERWLAAVAELADWVSDCDALVVSLGVDAAKDDPESPLQVTADGYREAGRLLGATGLPAVAVQEGGYHLPTLGGLVAAYLDGHSLEGHAGPGTALP
jgi:acetoin utilization deacetylase AcuC-like enzyme